MSPEKLKLLAEAQGYGSFMVNNDVWAYRLEDSDGIMPPDDCWRYNPEEFAHQREEVLLWLLGKGWALKMTNVFGAPVRAEYLFRKPPIVSDLDGGKINGATISDKDYTTALLQAAEKELGNE